MRCVRNASLAVSGSQRPLPIGLLDRCGDANRDDAALRRRRRRSSATGASAPARGAGAPTSSPGRLLPELVRLDLLLRADPQDLLPRYGRGVAVAVVVTRHGRWSSRHLVRLLVMATKVHLYTLLLCSDDPALVTISTLLCFHLKSIIRHRKKILQLQPKEGVVSTSLLQGGRMDPSVAGLDYWMGAGCINNYAMFLGYMLMGVRGLGLLVLMWSTIIVLSGFITLLQKDFWSLVVIMLIQIAGVLDFLLKEKLKDVVISVRGLLVALVGTVIRSTIRCFINYSVTRSILIMVPVFGLWLAQLVVFSIISIPLAFLCLYGLYISAGISLWRLVEHDYGDAGLGANLTSALQILYFLAVAQGVLFGYRAVYAVGARIRLAEDVADFYSLDLNIVSDYLNETVKGCSKDPLFVRGRNLVTYAVDMMLEPKPSDSYLSGVRILGTLIQDHKLIRTQLGTLAQIKQLLTGSASFVQMVQNLLWMLGPRSPYSREIKAQAARIVAHVACDIRMEQFLGGIHCISCLLDTTEEQCWRPEGYERHCRLPKMYERDWLLEEYERELLLEEYGRKLLLEKWLMLGLGEDEIQRPSSSMSVDGASDMLELQLQGMRILRKLTIHEGNCRVVINTEGLLSKIMAPLVSSKLHQDHHDEWSVVAEEALELMSRLMAAPGKIGSKLQREISSCGRAVSTMKNILQCGNCKAKLQRLATEIILDMSAHATSIMASGDSSRRFIRTLLELFLSKKIRVKPYQQAGGTMLELVPFKWAARFSSSSIHWMKKRSYIRNLAGKNLAMLSLKSEENATIILQNGVEVVTDLVKTTVDFRISNVYRTRAAEILEHLCSNYTQDDGRLLFLKRHITNVMPKVLKEIITYEETGADDQEIEYASHNNGHEYTYQDIGEQRDDMELKEALISLCETVCDTWVNTDSNVAGVLDVIATDDDARIVEEGTFCSVVKGARKLLLRKKKAQKVPAIVQGTSSRN